MCVTVHYKMRDVEGDSLSDLGLDGAGDAGVADAEQAAGGRAGGEPVTASQPLHQGLEVDLQVHRGVLLGDLSQGLHGFVSDNRLLNCGEALQGRLQVKKEEGQRSVTECDRRSQPNIELLRKIHTTLNRARC